VAAVRELSPYVPGKPIAELERELGIHEIAKLASNENPYGPSPQARRAMQRALADVWLYPDGSGFELKAALARHLHLDPDCLTLGNGSNELLVLLAESFLSPQHSAVYSQFGFAIYPLAIRATGARDVAATALPADHAMPLGHDLSAMARAIDSTTRLVFIANPNNPTGTWLSASALEAFVANAPAHALIVLDEAYLEYSLTHGGADGLPWLQKYPRLVLLRTFSKAYGLAGARVGYAISHPEVADTLNRLRPAFNVNSIALAGAAAAIADQPYMHNCVGKAAAELARMQAGLHELGLRTIPSTANFVLARVGARAADIYQTLLRGGVIVRPVAGYGLPEYLRISVGLPQQTDLLLKLLGQYLSTTP
jgi:histidinol-phosphate aminotransferase